MCILTVMYQCSCALALLYVSAYVLAVLLCIITVMYQCSCVFALLCIIAYLLALSRISAYVSALFC